MILAFVLYAFFALFFVFGKISLAYGAPIFAVSIRMLFAGTVLLSYLFFFDRKKLKIRKRDIVPLVLITVFNVFFTNVLEFWGLQYLISAKAGFLYNLTPFLTAFLSYLVFSERMSSKKWISLVGGFIGFLPILLSESEKEGVVGHALGFLSWPELALLGAATATTIGWIALRAMVKKGFSPLAANGISMLATGILCLPTSFIFEDWNPTPVKQWGPFIGWAILLAVIANIICYNLYGYLLKKYSATFLALAGLLMPVFTAVLGWFMIGEVVTWKFFLSLVMVLGSLYLFYHEELRQGYIKK